MGKRLLEIVIIKAESLPKQGVFSKTVVAATAYISSNPDKPQQTLSNMVRGTKPQWNQTLSFTLKYSTTFGTFDDSLNIELHNRKPDGSMSYIGKVHIPLKNWIELAGNQASTVDHLHVCQLSRGGNLHLSYRLGPYISKADKLLPIAKGALGFVVPFAGIIVGNVQF